MPDFIEVCAGAGGLSTGFINKGFTPKLLIDNDKNCCETLKKNHPDIKEKIICNDFTQINYTLYNFAKNIDILVGGISCQSYSYSGKKLGLIDPRGNLMLQFIDLIEQLLPKVFIIENVKGLVSHNSGETLKIILGKINKIKKYKIQYKVLNANNYNVPQKRERLFIIGINLDYKFKQDFVWPDEYDYKPVLKDILKNIPESKGYT